MRTLPLHRRMRKMRTRLAPFTSNTLLTQTSISIATYKKETNSETRSERSRKRGLVTSPQRRSPRCSMGPSSQEGGSRSLECTKEPASLAAVSEGPRDPPVSRRVQKGSTRPPRVTSTNGIVPRDRQEACQGAAGAKLHVGVCIQDRQTRLPPEVQSAVGSVRKPTGPRRPPHQSNHTRKHRISDPDGSHREIRPRDHPNGCGQRICTLRSRRSSLYENAARFCEGRQSTTTQKGTLRTPKVSLTVAEEPHQLAE